jgi:hypothetical protein
MPATGSTGRLSLPDGRAKGPEMPRFREWTNTLKDSIRQSGDSPQRPLDPAPLGTKEVTPPCRGFVNRKVCSNNQRVPVLQRGPLLAAIKLELLSTRVSSDSRQSSCCGCVGRRLMPRARRSSKWKLPTSWTLSRRTFIRPRCWRVFRTLRAGAHEVINAQAIMTAIPATVARAICALSRN